MDFINSIDFAILDFINEHLHTPILDFIFPKITLLGKAGILWIIITIVMLCVKRWRKCGMISALSLIICVVVGNLALKPLIGRIRPCDINTAIQLLVSRPTDSSFPSGHAMTSFASAASVFSCSKKAGVWFIIIAVLITFSRLYLYVHYPTDVFAGMILGIAATCLSYEIVKQLSKKKFVKKLLPQ